MSTRREKRAVAEILASPIAYYTAFARLGAGVTGGVFLSQLFYWTGKGADPEGWVYKTQKEWEDETGLTRREQETARKRLRELGVLEEERRGIPARLFYRVNMDRLFELVDAGSLRGSEDAPVQTRMAESAGQEWQDPPDKNGGIRQTSEAESAKLLQRIPETTAESTTESTAAAAPAGAAGPEADTLREVVQCSIHHVPMRRREKGGDVWYSHRLPDGTWCRGGVGDAPGGRGGRHPPPPQVDWRKYTTGQFAHLVQY